MVTGVDLASVGDRAGPRQLRAAGADADVSGSPTASVCRFPTTPRSTSSTPTASCSTPRTRSGWSTKCRRVLKPGGEAIFQVYNRDLVAECAVEADEGRPRARRCAGAAEVQHRANSGGCSSGFREVRIVPERFPVKSRLHGGWKGRRLQRPVRRHVQRAAADARRALRLAPAGVLPQMSSCRLSFAKPTPTATTFSTSDAAVADGRRARRARARAVRPPHRHRRRRADPLRADAGRRVDAPVERRRQPRRRCRATASAASPRCCCANGTTASGVLTIQTEAGVENVDANRASRTAVQTFRAAMGRAVCDPPADGRRRRRAGRRRRAQLRQSAVRRARPAARRRRASAGSAPALEHHALFPEGTNVEFAHVECARPRAHPDLGARRRPDDIVGHRIVRGAGRRGGVRRRGARSATVIAPGGRSGSSGATTASISPAGPRCSSTASGCASGADDPQSPRRTRTEIDFQRNYCWPSALRRTAGRRSSRERACDLA